MKKFLLSVVFCTGIWAGISDGYAEDFNIGNWATEDIQQLGGDTSNLSLLFKENNLTYVSDGVFVFQISYSDIITVKKIEVSEPNTFRNLKDGYEADKYNIYYQGIKIEEVDVSTLEYLENHFLKDKNFLYYFQSALKNIDVESATLLGGNYIKDKNGVYNVEYSRSVPMNDLNAYIAIEIKDIDNESFSILKYGYSQDKNNIYYNEKKIEGVDNESFQLFPLIDGGIDGGFNVYYYGKDNSSYYEEGKKMSKEEGIRWENNLKKYNDFSDVFNEHKHYLAISFVKLKKIVQGYKINGEKLFKPQNPINRAEFMKIVLLAKYSQAEIDEATNANFTDILAGEWYKKYADFGATKGFIRGYEQEDGTFTFGGTKNISFAEAAKIVVNILIEETQPSNAEGTNWYDPYVQKLSDKNVETYPVEKNITRGEMAAIIYGVMK